MLENCQTFYSGCPKRVDVPYWSSGHMDKSQGQTASLWELFSISCLSLDPFDGKLPNVVSVCFQRVDETYWCSGHIVKD